MKKQVLYFMNTFENESCRQFLEKQKEEGWILVEVGTFFLTFEKKEEDVQYAVDIINHTKHGLGYYLDFMEETGWEKIGNRGGIYFFKNNEETEFYTDSKLDQIINQSKNFRKIMFYCSLLLLLLAFYVHRVYWYGVLFDIVNNWKLVLRSSIFFVLFFFIIQVAFPYFYSVITKKNISPAMIEKRSWFVVIGIVTTIIYIYTFGLLLQDITNQSFIACSLAYWILCISIEFIVYKLRYRIKKLCLTSFSVVAVVALGLAFVSEPNPNPVKSVKENGFELSVDSEYIPLSLYLDKKDYVLRRNEMNESIFVKSYEVNERLNEYTFGYDFFEAKYNFVADYVENQYLEKTLFIFTEEKRLNDMTIYYSETGQAILRKGKLVVLMFYSEANRDAIFESVSRQMNEYEKKLD